VEAEEERAFLSATGTDAALLAGEGDEKLVPAVRTTDAGKAVLKVAALEELVDGLVDDRPPETELAGIAVGVDGVKVVEVFPDQAVKIGLQRLSGPVDADRLVDEADHDVLP
jgi:hypothetical protein